MKNRLNYLIILTVLFTSIILFTSIYFEIKMEQKVYSDITKMIEENSIINYKKQLKESIHFTEKTIDTYYDEIEEEYESIIKKEISKVEKINKEQTNEEVSRFINNYEHDTLNLSHENIENEYSIKEKI